MKLSWLSEKQPYLSQPICPIFIQLSPGFEWTCSTFGRMIQGLTHLPMLYLFAVLQIQKSCELRLIEYSKKHLLFFIYH